MAGKSDSLLLFCVLTTVVFACNSGVRGEEGCDRYLACDEPEKCADVYAEAQAASATSFVVQYATTKGNFTVNVEPSWAPQLISERFFLIGAVNLYEQARFYRVDIIDAFSLAAGKGPRPPWVAQTGLTGNTTVDACWTSPAMTLNCSSSPLAGSPGNVRGTVAFSMGADGECGNEIYINYSNNTRLDAQGFAPFGWVSDDDMENVIDLLFAGYGEVADLCTDGKDGTDDLCTVPCALTSSGECISAFCVGCGSENKGVNTTLLLDYGNTYLEEEKPELDLILTGDVAQIDSA